MNSILKKAYQLIFGHEPSAGHADWQMAEEILNHWDVPKLGENLAQECIYEIVDHVPYPDMETTRRIVRHAEELSTELFPELANHDPHMAVIEFFERRHHGKRDPELTKEQKSYINKKVH